MKTSRFSLCALFAGCVAIAACSQSAQLSRLQYIPSLNGVPWSRISPLSFGLLYTFGGSPDGAGPQADLTDVHDTLYGTTYNGGAYGGGTVFKLIGGNKDKVLHSFGFQHDSASPVAGLTDVKGTLYGTTFAGGDYCLSDGGCGTVYSISTTGAEQVLHSFQNGADGNEPFASLIAVNGSLYGTTAYGGAHNDGTVFAITTGGHEKVLYSFAGGTTDGEYPMASLIDVNGTLYGTTSAGGAHGDGTVFSVTTADFSEKVLYSFAGGTSDGMSPDAGLIDLSGVLYGTTPYGGAAGYGTVFSITTGGSEQVLHSFSGGVDGANPQASLTKVRGKLYGTTAKGGKDDNAGTVFSITTGGTEKVLHSFGGGIYGGDPLAGMIYPGRTNGNLVGTTFGGGASGNGVIFSLTP